VHEAGKVPGYVYPMLATFFLTGGQRAEVLGLEVADVSFDSGPQLEEILRPYVFSPDRPPAGLLFPRLGWVRKAMLTDFRQVVNRVTVPAGWKPGAIASKMFRHPYCSAGGHLGPGGPDQPGPCPADRAQLQASRGAGVRPARPRTTVPGKRWSTGSSRLRRPWVTGSRPSEPDLGSPLAPWLTPQRRSQVRETR
jgi:hypothetical protein